MAAIPFSLVGILPAHGVLHAFLTTTSMIGFIAGARNRRAYSIILVDFIELRLKEGMLLDQAVIDAGSVRFRPMTLTAASVIAGSVAYDRSGRLLHCQPKDFSKTCRMKSCQSPATDFRIGTWQAERPRFL